MTNCKVNLTTKERILLQQYYLTTCLYFYMDESSLNKNIYIHRYKANKIRTLKLLNFLKLKMIFSYVICRGVHRVLTGGVKHEEVKKE